MATVARGIQVTLTAAHAEALGRIALERSSTPEEVAGTLLGLLLDRTRFAPGEIEAHLDSIPGLYERMQESLAQGLAGRTVPLSDLRLK
jgi:hypothetical protein